MCSASFWRSRHCLITLGSWLWMLKRWSALWVVHVRVCHCQHGRVRSQTRNFVFQTRYSIMFPRPSHDWTCFWDGWKKKTELLPQWSIESSTRTCGEGELVSGVHTLVAGVVQVYHRLQVVEEEEQVRKVEQKIERENQGEENARMTMHMKMTWRRKHWAWATVHVCADEDKTTLTDKRECALTFRGSGCWCTHCEVPRKHRWCHWRSCHGVSRKHRCCHWHSRCAWSPSHKFSTFLNFPLRVQILILLSCCSNSSSLFPVAIFCTRSARGNTSFEVWYLHSPSVAVDRRQL